MNIDKYFLVLDDIQKQLDGLIEITKKHIEDITNEGRALKVQLSKARASLVEKVIDETHQN